jgi:hypothetical protein
LAKLLTIGVPHDSIQRTVRSAALPFLRLSPRAAFSTSSTDITIHASFLPHDDPDVSVAFCRDTLCRQMNRIQELR